MMFVLVWQENRRKPGVMAKCYTWTDKLRKQISKSAAIISEELTQTKHSVYIFMAISCKTHTQMLLSMPLQCNEIYHIPKEDIASAK